MNIIDNVSDNLLASIFSFAYIMLGTVQTVRSRTQKNQPGRSMIQKDTTAFNNECFHMHTVFGRTAHILLRLCSG